MKHFLNTQDLDRGELDALLPDAARYKRQLAAGQRMGDELAGKSIALVFFNPSLRTRASFEWARTSSAATRWCCSRARMPGRSSSTWARSWTARPRNTLPRWRGCSAAMPT